MPRCSLQDDFRSNVAVYNAYKRCHTDVIATKLTASIQN